MHCLTHFDSFQHIITHFRCQKWHFKKVFQVAPPKIQKLIYLFVYKSYMKDDENLKTVLITLNGCPEQE